MKIAVRLRDPYGLYESILRTVREEVNLTKGLSGLERLEALEAAMESTQRACERWFPNRQYCYIDLDLEADTATLRKYIP